MIRELQLTDVLTIVAAARWTLLLSLMAFAGSALVGLGLAVARLSSFAPLRWIVIGYNQIVQGTPLLVWLFLLYFGLAAIGIKINAWFSVTIAFSIYGGAFLGEAWYGAFRAVPKAQWEAASSLGLSYTQQFINVILPQSIRIATPPTVGLAVQLIKNTSLASTIGFYELTRSGVLLSGATYRPLLVFTIVGVLYFVICYPLTTWSRKLERDLHVAR